MTVGDLWYRVVGDTVQEEYRERENSVVVIEWQVIRETDKSVLIVRPRDVIGYVEYRNEWTEKHWVSKTARKRFAYPTKALALNSFEHRLSWRLHYAETALADAKAHQLFLAVVKGFIGL